MKERPILFSGQMVQEILEGRKTQTRRVIKPPFEIHANGDLTRPDGHGGRFGPYTCPYGQPGDRLWVRESFKPLPMDAPSAGPSQWMIHYASGGQKKLTAPAEYNPMLYNYERYTPSIHMPRWACRLVLEITDIRVERLQVISEEDTLAEGIGNGDKFETHHDEFKYLWNSINGKRKGYSWGDNPWVWGVAFKRMEGGAA